MRFIKSFNENNKISDWEDFLSDFGFFITLNISKLASYANSADSSVELTNILKEFRSPKVFGQKYSDYISNNLSQARKPEVISKLLKYVHDSLVYVEPRLKKYLTDEGKSIFLPRVNKLKERYKQQVSNFTSQKVTESLSDKFIEENIKDAIDYFNSKIDMFDNINVEYLTGENVGEYEFESALGGEPTIYLYKNTIQSLPEDEVAFAIRTTIFHELCHAMVDIDNNFVFIEDENILKFEDEEEFCEEFAVDFEMFDRIPKEILTLAELFKNKKWIREAN